MSSQQNMKTMQAKDLVDFFGNDSKEMKTQIEKRNIHNGKKYCTD